VCSDCGNDDIFEFDIASRISIFLQFFNPSFVIPELFDAYTIRRVSANGAHVVILYALLAYNAIMLLQYVNPSSDIIDPYAYNISSDLPNVIHVVILLLWSIFISFMLQHNFNPSLVIPQC